MRIPLLIVGLFLTTFLQAQTFTAGGGAIPDNSAATHFPLTVSGLSPGTIDTIFGLETVCFDIIHPYDGDISIQLKSPDGMLIDLSMRNGGGGQNYSGTCFDGYTANFISAGFAPYNGTYRAEDFLGDVNNGQNGNGTWELVIADMAAADSGNLINWSLTFGNTPAHPFVFTPTNLPLLLINTVSQLIPDEPKIEADMSLIDHSPSLNMPIDVCNLYCGKIGIEMRGSSSMWFPQKSYGFQTQDTNGLEVNTPLLQMPSESDWILYAPYDDKTLMRNAFTYELGRDMGRYAPRCRFVELFINNKYKGVYVLMEKIKRNNQRVNISRLYTFENSGDELTGGYIFKIDKTTGSSGGAGWYSNYAPAVSTSGQTILFQYHYPSADSITVPQKNYLAAYVDSFERALSTVSVYDTTLGYRHFMDEASFIDFFLINEISKNVDGYRLSSFFYKDRNSHYRKLVAGPFWDFNLAWWNANYCQGNNFTGWSYKFGNVCAGDSYQVPFWWDTLMTDTIFTRNLRCRWDMLRETVFDTVSMFHKIDSMATLLSSAQSRHFTAWPILGVYTWPNPFPLPTSYAGEISALKTWIKLRVAWMDDNVPGSGVCPVDTVINTSTPEQGTENYEIEITNNPVHHTFGLTFSNPTNKNSVIEIYDVTGRSVWKQAIVKDSKYVEGNIASLPSGVYFVSVLVDHKKTFLKKLIKLS